MTLETGPLLRSAGVMRLILLLIFGGMMIGGAFLLVWLALDLPQAGMMLMTLAGFEETVPRHWQSLALGAIVLLHVAIWCGVLWRGQQVFAALLATDVTQASVAARQMAVLLWAMLIWGVLTNTLVPLVATWHFPPGQRMLAFGLGSAQISTVLAAVLATFTSHAFVLGAALWQDHKEVI